MQIVELLLGLQEGTLSLTQMLAARGLLDLCLLTRRYGCTVNNVHKVL